VSFGSAMDFAITHFTARTSAKRIVDLRANFVERNTIFNDNYYFLSIKVDIYQINVSITRT
jgi:hypothetical protein